MTSIYFQEPSTDGAPGIWDLNDAVRFQAMGHWPTIPATVPDWLLRGPDGRLPADQADFARGRGWFNGQPYPNLHAYLLATSGSFSRGSDGTYFDKNGIMRTAGPNVLRLTHDPVTGEALGYLAEGSGSNLLLHSDDVAHTWWTKQGAPTVEISDDGGWRIIKTGPATLTSVGRFALTAATTITIQCEFKKTFYDAFPALATFNNSGVGGGIVINARTGEMVRHTSGVFGGLNWNNAAGMTHVITDAGDYWRVQLRATNHSGFFIIPVWNSDGSVAYDPDALGEVIIRRPQYETALFGSSYIQTGATATQRLADSLTFARAAPPSGTVAIEARTATGLDGDQTLWCWDNGTTDNRLWLGRDGSRVLRWIVTVGGVDVINLDLGVVADNTDLKVAASWGGVNAASLDGSAAVVDNTYSGPMPVVTTHRVGSASDGTAWFGTVANIRMFGTAYTPAQLAEASNV